MSEFKKNDIVVVKDAINRSRRLYIIDKYNLQSGSVMYSVRNSIGDIYMYNERSLTKYSPIIKLSTKLLKLWME